MNKTTNDTAFFSEEEIAMPPIIDENLVNFDQADVDLMIRMLMKFDELHRGTGVPDYSVNYGAYLPVFALSLLASQQEAARLSKRLELLTWALLFLTAIMAVLTLTLIL